MDQENRENNSESLLPITLGRYLSLIDGCEFIGVSDSGEVFVSWHGLDPAAKEKAMSIIGDWPEVTKVTEVYSISRKEVEDLVNGLNDLLEQTKETIDVQCLREDDSGTGGGEREEVRKFLESYYNDQGGSGSSGCGGCQSKPSHVCPSSCGDTPSGDGCGGCGS